MFLRLLVAQSFLLIGMMFATQAFAQQTSLPLLHDGEERNGFVGGFYTGCLKQRRAAKENETLSTTELGAFCLCVGRGLADVTNGAENEAIAVGKIPDSFAEKTRAASEACITRMTVTQKMSDDQRLRKTTENKCVKEFHPEDTDYPAAKIRDAFCGCYAGATLAKIEAKGPRDGAADFCYQRLGDSIRD